MMKEFYEDILNRAPESPTPIEKVILWECTEADGFDPLHERRIAQMLEDIRTRKAMAEAADGRDWVVATFEGLLNRAISKAGDPFTEDELKALSPMELRTRRTAQRNRLPARAYECRKQGLPCQDKKAERRLLRLYENIIGRLEGNFSPDVSQAQTFHRLVTSPYRIFSRNCTGVNQYRYCRADHLLGSAEAQVIPGFPVRICWGNQVFCSEFDGETTLAPGIFRDIVSEKDPAVPAARLTWKGTGLHELEIFRSSTTIQIQKEAEYHKFYAGQQCIAELVSLPRKQQLLDWEVNVCLKFHEELPAETQMLLMSFPLLQIGL